MQINLKNQKTTALLCASVVLVLLFVDLSAQQGRRRRKPSRRITHPVAQGRSSATMPAQTDAPEIISTDDASANGSDNNTQSNNGPRNRNRSITSSSSEADSDTDSGRRSDNKMSTDMTRLSDRLGRIEEQQRAMVDLERLSRAEQRAENLRAQLRDVVARQSDLQARAENLDIDLQPGNIENSLAGVGSTHPEELRAQRRRQLESEKTRVRNQLDLLDKNRASLETSIASADTEADRLRQRVDAASAATQTNTNSTTNNSSSSQTGTGTAGATASPPPSPSPNDSRTPR